MASNSDFGLGNIDGNNQYLVFVLGDENYAIDLLSVQEIRSYEKVTRIANSPSFIKGVTNLRGVIVPIIDLRIKFNLENVKYAAETVVIVVNIGSKVMGFVVDSVSDVTSISKELLQPPPEFTLSSSSDYISSIATVNEQMLIVMDIGKLMTNDEILSIKETVTDQAASEIPV